MKALTVVGAGVLAAGITRARLRNWGATREEVDAIHPGDDLVAGPVPTSTYAVTVQVLLMTRRMLVGIKRRAEHDAPRPQAGAGSAIGMPR